MSDEIASAALQRVLGIKSVLSELAQRSIAKRGSKRGSYELEASVSGYCEHLHSMAAGRGGEVAQTARERLGQAQATLAEAKA